MDLRAPITQAQIAQLFADAQSHIWDLAIWGNSRLDSCKSAIDPEAADFELLTRQQQALVLVGTLDGEVGNGGMGQLFFNCANLVPAMENALREMGCEFAADLLDRETERISRVNFMSRWSAAQNELAADLPTQGMAVAGQHFANFLAEFYAAPPGMTCDPATEAYFNRREQTLDCVKAYIRLNSSFIFDVSEESSLIP